MKTDYDLKLIRVTYDYAFKKMFRGNLDILREFLKEVIPLDITEDGKIRLMDGELFKENKNESKKIIDIEDISKATKLTLEEVQKLKNDKWISKKMIYQKYYFFR